MFSPVLGLIVKKNHKREMYPSSSTQILISRKLTDLVAKLKL